MAAPKSIALTLQRSRWPRQVKMAAIALRLRPNPSGTMAANFQDGRESRFTPALTLAAFNSVAEWMAARRISLTLVVVKMAAMRRMATSSAPRATVHYVESWASRCGSALRPRPWAALPEALTAQFEWKGTRFLLLGVMHGSPDSVQHVEKVAGGGAEGGTAQDGGKGRRD